MTTLKYQLITKINFGFLPRFFRCDDSTDMTLSTYVCKHHKKTSKINPVVPKTLQFYEDGQDCDDISNNGNDEATENDGHQIVTRVEVYDYVGSIDKADENSVKSDENCQYLELSISNVKLTEIGEAFGQLPGEVCHI